MSYETNQRLLTPVIRWMYRLQVRGQEHVPAAGAFVAAGNHDSMIDPFVMAAAIHRPMHFLGKAELWGNPVARWWLESVGAIPVRRGGSDAGAIESAVAALEAGRVVGIFPEGGVKREGPWLRGAARLALQTGAPLLPVRLFDTRKALGRNSFGFPPLTVLIGEPIHTERTTPTADLARTLTDRLQVAVEALGT